MIDYLQINKKQNLKYPKNQKNPTLWYFDIPIIH